MSNISLSTRDFKRALVFFSFTVIVIISVYCLVRHLVFGATGIRVLIQGFISGVGLAATISIWILKRKWTTEWLALIAGKPIIHGVWFGHLYTNYNEGVSGSDPIPIAFIIEQTYLGYSLFSYTKQRESETLVESLTIDERHNTTHLRYMYQFHVKKAEERNLITGAAELKLVEAGERLYGYYLTNSPTQGSVDLRLVQRNCHGIDSFSRVQRLWAATRS